MCAAVSLSLPISAGAATVAVLFPLLVALACGDVSASDRAIAGAQSNIWCT